MVRAVKGSADQFEIVAGERRWRAAQRAGLHEVPIITVEVNDAEALELAIIENVQRADLNPLEEAMGYQSLIDQYKHSQNDVARFVGKSRSHVANTLRLLQLSETIKAYKLGSTPQTLVISRDGKVLKNWVGAYVGKAR